MKSAIIIKWIDRQWGEYPNAPNWLGLIIVGGLLPLMAVGWRPITVAVAILWAAAWTILFSWRWTVHIRKVDSAWQKRRKKP